MSRGYLLAFGLLVASQAVSAVPTPAGSRVESGNLLFDNIPTNTLQANGDSGPDAYLQGREAIPLGFSPKGQLLIATRFGETDQLHLVERPLGARHQLTYWNEPITQAVFSPDPGHNAWVYLADVSDDNTQLYYQRYGEAPRLLTDGKSINTTPVWSNAGRMLAFASTARDDLNLDIDIVEPDSKAPPRLVLSGEGNWSPLDWSPDDGRLLVLKTLSNDENYLYALDLSTGAKREIEISKDKGVIKAAKFSRDGAGVYFISNRGSEFSQLRYQNLLNGEVAVVSAQIPWDIETLAISHDGHYLAYVSNEAGLDKLNILDLRAHQDLNPAKLPAPGMVTHLEFDQTNSHLAFGFSASNQPLDAYVLDIATNHLEAWTTSEPGPIPLSKFVIPRLVHFPTFDRQNGSARAIPAYVYEPTQPGVHPVLIALPSEAHAQFRPQYAPGLQYLVNELGFVVITPNLRGATGYGKNYASLISGALREDAIKDLGALLVWLGGQNNYDAKHTFVSGDYYGGFLALSALVNYGGRLQGAIIQGGIADFPNYLNTISPPARSLRRAEFGDERNPEQRAYLRRISPLTSIDRIKQPILLVQGRDDALMPLADTQQLLASLRTAGVEVWYLQANNEGHFFRIKTNRDAYLRTVARFLRVNSRAPQRLP